MKQAVTGADVLRIREASGLSQRRFGSALGKSEKTVRNWEGGATIPEADQLLLQGVDAALRNQRAAELEFCRMVRDRFEAAAHE